MTPAELAELHARCFAKPRPWTAAEFVSLLDGPGCFLLTSDNSFLLGRVVADEAELLTLAVAPELRQRGIGTGLVAAFEARAVEMGAKRAFLEVAADNSAALSLYRATGFEPAGRRPRYYRDASGHFTDAILLRKPLD